MKIWKPLTKSKNQREEWVYHCDFSIESDEQFHAVVLADRELVELEIFESPPKKKQYKIHLEICVEPFEVSE